VRLRININITLTTTTSTGRISRKICWIIRRINRALAKSDEGGT